MSCRACDLCGPYRARPEIHRTSFKTMTNGEVPVIDIAPFLSGDAVAGGKVASEVDAALRGVGFMTIVGHEIQWDTVTRARDLAAEFFGYDLDEKMRAANPPEHMSRGYNWIGNRSLAYTLGQETPPDLQEGFAFGPWDFEGEIAPQASSFFAPNTWPARPSAFRAAFEDYYRSFASLATSMMRLFAVALGLPPSYFADKVDKHTSVVRVVHYPPQPDLPASGQLRAGPHTDYGTMTLLYADDTPGGLQVESRGGEWIDVHPGPGALVCNIGDLMARWTNDRWHSNLHRVANPPREHASTARIAIPFFHNANFDAEIRSVPTCLGPDGGSNYPPAVFGDLYLEKQTRAERKPGLHHRTPAP